MGQFENFEKCEDQNGKF